MSVRRGSWCGGWKGTGTGWTSWRWTATSCWGPGPSTTRTAPSQPPRKVVALTRPSSKFPPWNCPIFCCRFVLSNCRIQNICYAANRCFIANPSYFISADCFTFLIFERFEIFLQHIFLSSYNRRCDCSARPSPPDAAQAYAKERYEEVAKGCRGERLDNRWRIVWTIAFDWDFFAGCRTPKVWGSQNCTSSVYVIVNIRSYLAYRHL